MGCGYPNEKKMVRKYFLLPISSLLARRAAYDLPVFLSTRVPYVFLTMLSYKPLLVLSIFFLYRFLIPPVSFLSALVRSTYATSVMYITAHTLMFCVLSSRLGAMSSPLDSGAK
jgi:hypothetical protein